MLLSFIFQNENVELLAAKEWLQKSSHQLTTVQQKFPGNISQEVGNISGENSGKYIMMWRTTLMTK